VSDLISAPGAPEAFDAAGLGRCATRGAGCELDGDGNPRGGGSIVDAPQPAMTKTKEQVCVIQMCFMGRPTGGDDLASATG